MSAEKIRQELHKAASNQKQEFFPRFFKTGKGEYGEGDKFLGVTVPEIRKISKTYKDIPESEIIKLLADEYHECRTCALCILVEKFKKEKEEGRKNIVQIYLSHTQFVNNWDLVDISAKDILGFYLIDKSDRSVLYQLAKSNILWEQRIAVISTFAFIKNDDFEDLINLAEYFLVHKHDLIHKAVGWMLREMGKRDKDQLLLFLNKNYKIMPRTMLRYSIEKLDVNEKIHYMRKE